MDGSKHELRHGKIRQVKDPDQLERITESSAFEKQAEEETDTNSNYQTCLIAE